MQQQLLNRVREIVATLFDAPLEEITAQTSQESVEGWDSMGHLSLIIELEQEFSVQLAPEQTETMTTVDRITAILSHSCAN